MNELIYAADDDADIRNLLSTFLRDAGYRVEAFETGDLLYAAYLKTPCDLAILDIMMPGSDGLQICAKLRAISQIPIIILTARESELDFIMGITVGGDDYLTKPFRPSVLTMRVKALLRRMEMNRTQTADENAASLRFGDLAYSQKDHAIRCGKKDLGLTVLEFDLLLCLLQAPDKAFSREELLSRVWGISAEIETRVTDETMRRVRKKLALAQSRVQVQTLWGFGYRLGLEDREE